MRADSVVKDRYNSPEPEGGSFADVEDLGMTQERDEGSELAFEGQVADEAVLRNVPLLTVAPPAERLPVEIRAHDADGVGLLEERTKGPIDVGARDVEMRHLEDAAQHEERQGAERRGQDEPTPFGEPCRREKAERDAVRLKVFGEARARGERFDAVENKRMAVASEPRPGHAFHGKKGESVQLDRLAEEQQVEQQRIAGDEIVLGRRGLEHIRTWRRGKAAQHRRRLVFDERLEQSGVETGAAQRAGRALVSWFHGADSTAESVSERAAQQRALVRRKACGGEGAQSEAQAEVWDGREPHPLSPSPIARPPPGEGGPTLAHRHGFAAAPLGLGNNPKLLTRGRRSFVALTPGYRLEPL